MRLLVVLGLVVCVMGKPKVIFKPLKPHEAVPRELENEAISEEESLEWLGELHYKENNLGVTMHLQCDGCWELMSRLQKELAKVSTRDVKGGVKTIYDTFCNRMTGYLRLVLDDDGIALPKYGVGRTTAVFGGWPHKYLTKLCTAIYHQHPVEDFIQATEVLLGITRSTDPTALDVCTEKYHCPKHSYERRLNVSKMMKATNYTVYGSASNDYHLKNMPTDEGPVEMTSEVMSRLRAEYATLGLKKNPTDHEVLQFHREIEEQRQKRLVHEKMMKEASERVDRQQILAEKLKRRKENAEQKRKDGDEKQPRLIDIKKQEL